MIFYDGGGAPNARRVRIYLSEKGLNIPMKTIDIMKSEHKTDEYKKISPLSQVPALELDDGTFITESIAICRYFEALNPDPNLMGTDPNEIAIIEMWQRRLELLLMMPIASVFRHGHPAMAHLENQVIEWSEANKPRILGFYNWLDKQLKGKDFICLNRYTLADVTALTCFEFAKWPKINIPEDCLNLKKYYQMLSDRPSAKA
ncbi:glutathione S-transferase [Rhodobiaceae bacterium]|nr:glutathione S-transferase [Rhodobiaceae bacterium]